MALPCRYLKMMDQRFPASQELLFKRSLQSHFVFPGYIGAVASAASAFRNLTRSSHDLSDPMLLVRSIAITFNIVMSLLAVMTLLARRWLHPINMEVTCIVSACALSVSFTMCSEWHVALIFGRDPHQAFGSEVETSESSLAFSMVSLSTFFGLLIPLRSHLSWAVHICGLGCFGAASLALGSPFPTGFPRLLLLIAYVGVTNWVGGFRIERHLRERWFAQRQVEKQKDLINKQHQAFSHLLNRLCDCLLHLGPDFKILKPNRNLNAMLFLGDEKTLQGCSFCDYLASNEDTDHFVAAMESGTSEDDLAGIIPLHLRDSQGREVLVHAYYSCFHDQEGSPYYVVGIVEAGEPTARGFLRNSHMTSGQASCIPDNHVSDNADSESELPLESVSGDELGEVSVTVEVNRSFNIISCTPGFTALSGPAGDRAPLADWVVDSWKFTRLIQSRVNQFAANNSLGELVLRTPNATRAGIEYVIEDCTLEALTVTDDSTNPAYDQFTLRLRLDQISQRVIRRPSRETKRIARSERQTRQGL